MNRILTVLSIFLCLSIGQVSAGVLSSLSQRRPQVDQLLLNQKAIEGANGYLRENGDSKKSVSPKDRQLIEAENKDRRDLFGKMAKNDSQIKDGNHAGKQLALKYIGLYKNGVLRENPSNKLIYDSWPPEVKSVEALLTEFFQPLDTLESQMRASVESH